MGQRKEGDYEATLQEKQIEGCADERVYKNDLPHQVEEDEEYGKTGAERVEAPILQSGTRLESRSDNCWKD